MEIQIKVKGLPVKPIQEFEAFQGNLKTLSEEDRDKLIASIARNGFNAPIYIWADHNYILDGHQRIVALRHMFNNGWTLSGGQLPYVEIEADTEKQAAEMVLTYNSQYGKITEESFMDFMDEKGVVPDVFDIINFPNFATSPLIEMPEKDLSDGVETENECPKCGYKW